MVLETIFQYIELLAIAVSAIFVVMTWRVYSQMREIMNGQQQQDYYNFTETMCEKFTDDLSSLSNVLANQYDQIIKGDDNALLNVFDTAPPVITLSQLLIQRIDELNNYTHKKIIEVRHQSILETNYLLEDIIYGISQSTEEHDISAILKKTKRCLHALLTISMQ